MKGKKMKEWQKGLVAAVILLLVVALVVLAVKAFQPQSVNSQDSVLDIKGRIEQYKLIKEEQQLITDIMTLRYEAALIRAKFNPADANTP